MRACVCLVFLDYTIDYHSASGSAYLTDLSHSLDSYLAFRLKFVLKYSKAFCAQLPYLDLVMYLSMGTCIECLQDTTHTTLNKHQFWLKTHSLVYTLSTFLWVRWFGMEPSQYCHGFQVGHLPKIGFVKSSDNYAFTFLDPTQVIRGAHLIPAFAEGRSSALLPAKKSIACILNPNDEDNWLNFYVNM